MSVNGRVLSYYLVFVSALLLLLAAFRIVNSPFGRVLQAIRENDFRAESLGYNVVYYRTVANCLAAGMAVLAGAMSAIWVRYTGPDTTLSFAIMLDILLMVVIGGMGTLYGAVVGATLFILAQNYLQKLMSIASEATAGLPLIPHLLAPRPLAAVARRVVHPERLLLSKRYRRQAQRDAAQPVRGVGVRHTGLCRPSCRLP